MFFLEKSENDRYVKQLRSSVAVAVIVDAHSGPANWFEVGRGYEHFAPKATALGVRTAFVNQPIEVPAVRSPLPQWLGIGSQRSDLGTSRSRSAVALLIAAAAQRGDCVT